MIFHPLPPNLIAEKIKTANNKSGLTLYSVCQSIRQLRYSSWRFFKLRNRDSAAIFSN